MTKLIQNRYFFYQAIKRWNVVLVYIPHKSKKEKIKQKFQQEIW